MQQTNANIVETGETWKGKTEKSATGWEEGNLL